MYRLNKQEFTNLVRKVVKQESATDEICAYLKDHVSFDSYDLEEWLENECEALTIDWNDFNKDERNGYLSELVDTIINHFEKEQEIYNESQEIDWSTNGCDRYHENKENF